MAIMVWVEATEQGNHSSNNDGKKKRVGEFNFTNTSRGFKSDCYSSLRLDAISGQTAQQQFIRMGDNWVLVQVRRVLFFSVQEL